MKNSIKKRGDSKNKTDERTGSTDVEEGAVGSNGRAHENESTKSANERRQGNEEGIAGADVMIAASKEMAEFVSKKNREQGEGKRESVNESRGMTIKKREVVQKLMDGGNFAREKETANCVPATRQVQSVSKKSVMRIASDFFEGRCGTGTYSEEFGERADQSI